LLQKFVTYGRKSFITLAPGRFQHGHFLYFACLVHQGKEGLLPGALVQHPVAFHRLLHPIKAVFGLLLMFLNLFIRQGCYDTQFNGIQHNDTQHNI
jgi:hypothetical protein